MTNPKKEEDFFTLKFKCKCGKTLRWRIDANAVTKEICDCGKIYVLDNPYSI